MRAGLGMLVAALAVVLVDELVDGTKSAALPLMRQGLHLTYGQLGLLASVPIVLAAPGRFSTMNCCPNRSDRG